MVIDVEEERKEIINRYRRLLRKAKPILKEGDAKLIKRAFTISMEAHKEMRRKSGEPYIFHPLSVAEICVEEIGLGTTSIIAALLHDVVEDTDIPDQDKRWVIVAPPGSTESRLLLARATRAIAARFVAQSARDHFATAGAVHRQ